MHEEMTTFSPNFSQAVIPGGSFYKLNIVKSLRCATCSSEEVQRHKFPTKDNPTKENRFQSHKKKDVKVITKEPRMRKCLGFL